MELYLPVLRKFLRLVLELWLKRIEEELQIFADALDGWLHEMFSHPTPDWRESFAQLLAEQEAEGRTPTPESRQDLLDYLEGWAKTVDWRAVAGAPNNDDRPMVVVAAAPESVGEQQPGSPQAVGRLAAAREKGEKLNPAESFFFGKLALAQRHLHEMERVLRTLGQKLDAAEEGEEVEIESEVDVIEALIWQHNDALESARDAWLRDDLGSGAFDRLMLMSSPAAFGLPRFVDERQAERAKIQGKRITKRLDRRVAALDQIIFGMKVVEYAGIGASLALGGGVVLQAIRSGGKWAVVKTVARVAAAGAVAHGTGKAAEHGLRAAGASEETIHGVRLAAEVVTWLLLLRRVRAAGPKSAPTTAPKPPAPKAGASTNPRSLRSDGPSGPLQNPSGNLEDAARAARTQPHGPVPARRTRRKARLPRRGTPERVAIEKARREGINARKSEELANIRAGGKGSGVWTEAELQQIRQTGKFPADVRWHHDPTVANRPDLAADPAVVHPVRGGTRGHLDAHGGDFRKP